MSEVKNTGFQKMECGDMHHNRKKFVLSDTGSGFVDLQIVGTDINEGVIIGADIVADYTPGLDAEGNVCANPDGTFLICIETAGVFYVTLFDGSDFVITLVQSTAYLGQWYPAKLESVNVGTTGDFSVGY